MGRCGPCRRPHAALPPPPKTTREAMTFHGLGGPRATNASAEDQGLAMRCTLLVACTRFACCDHVSKRYCTMHGSLCLKGINT